MPLMSLLTLSKDETSTKVAGSKRLASVEEARQWPSGPDVEHKQPTVIFDKGRYTVRLSKPGKEAAPDYQRVRYTDGHTGNNPNDMRPEITEDGKLMERNASFTDVFDELQKLSRASLEGLELMGCLLARSAFMADHKEVSPGIWRYSPPEKAIQELSERIPLIYGVPVEVFLHYLNALALNEDVKYHTLGYDVRLGYGRRNNLLTCVNLVGVLLDRVGIASFAGSFSRPPAGISAISLTKMREIFPSLN
jgi:hypothetical protein